MKKYLWIVALMLLAACGTTEPAADPTATNAPQATATAELAALTPTALTVDSSAGPSTDSEAASAQVATPLPDPTAAPATAVPATEPPPVADNPCELLPVTTVQTALAIDGAGTMNITNHGGCEYTFIDPGLTVEFSQEEASYLDDLRTLGGQTVSGVGVDAVYSEIAGQQLAWQRADGAFFVLVGFDVLSSGLITVESLAAVAQQFNGNDPTVAVGQIDATATISVGGSTDPNATPGPVETLSAETTPQPTLTIDSSQPLTTCIIGSWVWTTEAIEAYLSTVMNPPAAAEAGAPELAVEVSGDMLFQFGPISGARNAGAFGVTTRDLNITAGLEGVMMFPMTLVSNVSGNYELVARNKFISLSTGGIVIQSDFLQEMTGNGTLEGPAFGGAYGEPTEYICGTEEGETLFLFDDALPNGGIQLIEEP